MLSSPKRELRHAICFLLCFISQRHFFVIFLITFFAFFASFLNYFLDIARKLLQQNTESVDYHNLLHSCLH